VWRLLVLQRRTVKRGQMRAKHCAGKAALPAMCWSLSGHVDVPCSRHDARSSRHLRATDRFWAWGDAILRLEVGVGPSGENII
ncbi:hypothetical protein, partial [uncultured Devosia sp.]|uniref:hypothetical protein n=1 Tax=uncultured Devosia sp. TaxID=211434 RepID=UPI002604F87D